MSWRRTKFLWTLVKQPRELSKNQMQNIGLFVSLVSNLSVETIIVVAKYRFFIGKVYISNFD